MYKLLIVDDEQIVSNGLKKFVAWSVLGFEVVATPLSVAKALAYLEDYPVDVIMTDIRMPIQTGIDLLRIVSSDYPHIKTLILSGHADFDYAREALRLGAVDFITKPVNFDELKKIFTTLKGHLDEQHLHTLAPSDYIHLKKEALLNTLILSGQLVDPPSTLEQLKLYASKDVFLFRVLIDLPLSKYQDLHHLKSTLVPLLQNYLSTYGEGHLFNNAPQELCGLFYPDQLINLNKFFQEILDLIHLHTPLPIRIGVSNNFYDLQDIKSAYHQAGHVLRYQLLHPQPYSFYQDIDATLPSPLYLDDALKSHLLTLLETPKLDELFITIDSLFLPYLSEEDTSLSQVYHLALSIVILLYEYCTNTKEATLSTEDLHKILHLIISCPSVSAVKKQLLDYVSSIVSTLTSTSSTYGNLINTALLYIEDHYAEDITLNTLGDLLYLHPAYLSKLFKEKTGKNFITYLTDLRIEKSKEFLKDLSLKIYTISELVGYDNAKYFSKLFKSVTDMTPREYRDSLGVTKSSL